MIPCPLRVKNKSSDAAATGKRQHTTHTHLHAHVHPTTHLPLICEHPVHLLVIVMDSILYLNIYYVNRIYVLFFKKTGTVQSAVLFA